MPAIDCREVRESLPWLANETLAGAERARVEAHLAACAPCRAEAERCRAERAALRAEDLTAPSPHPAQLERLLARIERSESGAGETGPGASRGPAALLRRTPRPVRIALAAELVAIAGLGLLLARAPGDLPPATAATSAAPFRTLSDPPAGETGALRVVFDPAATEAEVRALLLSAGSEIVAGPSPGGAYTLRLVPAAHGPALGEVLALLRADPRVRLAEPVAGAGDESPESASVTDDPTR
jgi:hypothetical protein